MKYEREVGLPRTSLNETRGRACVSRATAVWLDRTHERCTQERRVNDPNRILFAAQNNNSLLNRALCSIQPVQKRHNILSPLSVYPLLFLVICYIEINFFP